MVSDGSNGVVTIRRVPVLRVGESLARILRERILNGEFVNGELPQQDALVEQFGVSAPSVREAFRVLEAEGLITVRRGNVGGAVVRLPDSADTAYALGIALQAESATFSDVAEGIRSLDPLVAVFCAMRPDRHDATVPELRRICDDAAAHIEDELRWSKLACAFHTAVADFCGNNTMRVMVHALFSLRTAQFADRDALIDASLPAERRQVDAEHRTLTDAIAAGNLPAVKRISERHICVVQQVLRANPQTAMTAERVRRPA